jgi:prephenate dehydrogenase
MPVQISILGLNQIGASFGLALASLKEKEQVIRVGSDRDLGKARQAEKMGAIDKTSANLHASVENADVVILALPVDEIRITLEAIAADLKPGCVVVDTSPVKAAVTGWADELVPAERYFVSLTPTISPLHLMQSGNGIEAARADLFKDSMMLITCPANTDESAITLATNLTKVVGATPLFSDPAEADGLLAATYLLPELVSAALVNATINQPGWREARKVAGRAYAQSTELALQMEGRSTLGDAALLNAENTARMINEVIYELGLLRDALQTGSGDTLNERLQNAQQARGQWILQRNAANWEPRADKDSQLPTGREILGRLIGFRPKKDK